VWVAGYVNRLVSILFDVHIQLAETIAAQTQTTVMLVSVLALVLNLLALLISITAFQKCLTSSTLNVLHFCRPI